MRTFETPTKIFLCCLFMINYWKLHEFYMSISFDFVFQDQGGPVEFSTQDNLSLFKPVCNVRRFGGHLPTSLLSSQLCGFVPQGDGDNPFRRITADMSLNTHTMCESNRCVKDLASNGITITRYYTCSIPPLGLTVLMKLYCFVQICRYLTTNCIDKSETENVDFCDYINKRLRLQKLQQIFLRQVVYTFFIVHDFLFCFHATCNLNVSKNTILL